MFELIANEGEDTPMDMKQVGEALEDAGEAADDTMMSEGEDMMEDGEEMEGEEEMDPMKADFMASRKGPEKRPGTAIMIAKTSVDKGPLSKLEDMTDGDLPMKFKKKKKKWE